MAEIKGIEDFGVKIVLNSKVDDPAHVAADALGRVAGFAESGSPTNGA